MLETAAGISHSSGHTMWGYLGSFIFYTLLVIGFLYAVYFYLKKNPGILTFSKTFVHSKTESNPLALVIESRIALEPRKTVYVLRSGEERFLVSTAGEHTHLLSKLETVALHSPEKITQAEKTTQKEPV